MLRVAMTGVAGQPLRLRELGDGGDSNGRGVPGVIGNSPG